MKIIERNPKDLIPASYNPRQLSIEEHQQISASLKRFGFVDPIIVNINKDRKDIIIGGHQRTRVALEMGMELVPTVELDLTLEREKELNVRLNKNSGSWDYDVLGNEFDTADLLAWGFEEGELDFFEDEEDPEVEEDDFDEEPPENPVTELGRIYQLGNHRLMCGDSTSEKDVGLLMDGKKAEMTFTDPPYLMNFTGAVNADGSKSFGAIHGAIKNDKMSRADGDVFISSIVKNIKEFCTGAYYICFYRLGVDYVFRALDENDLKYRAQIIWFKKGGTLSNSDYKSNYEPIIYGWINDHNFHGGKAEWDFWDISKTKKNDLHPTMKPIELCARAIKNSAKKGELVLDLFGGSGSTLIACEETSRQCRMMELDPKYCDVIVRRYCKFKGIDPETVFETGVAE